MDRHERQRRLLEVGAAGQERIARARVDVTVEGFAGAVAARYLAGAGVAALRVRDAQAAQAAHDVDPAVRVEVAASPPADALGEADRRGPTFDLRDPVARELARGAHLALSRLREALGMDA